MSTARNGATRRAASEFPFGSISVLIFDVDGVLVDVRRTYWRSALDTVRALSGKRVTYRELHQWKHKPGHNDDWRMTSAWATALGRPTTYEEARAVFEGFYWGKAGKPGHVRNERMAIETAQIRQWAKHYELNIFTGRTRREFAHTFERWPGARHFRTVITMDDVERGKPHPDGLHRILRGRDPRTALYVGDNVDDALAARAAGVPFAAIVSAEEPAYRERASHFAGLGAVALLPSAAALRHLLPHGVTRTAS